MVVSTSRQRTAPGGSERSKSAARPSRRVRARWLAKWLICAGRFRLLNTALMARVTYLRRVAEVPGRVTVITATYNRPALLAEAIDSVRSQKYSHWEQIVVSDGRDDRVPALVARYGDSRITSYHTSRLAVMGNYQRNFALQYATGEFVLYLDDDNVLYPDALAVMVKGFTAPDIGYVVCPIRYRARVLRPPRELCT